MGVAFYQSIHLYGLEYCRVGVRCSAQKYAVFLGDLLATSLMAYLLGCKDGGIWRSCPYFSHFPMRWCLQALLVVMELPSVQGYSLSVMDCDWSRTGCFSINRVNLT